MISEMNRVPSALVAARTMTDYRRFSAKKNRLWFFQIIETSVCISEQASITQKSHKQQIVLRLVILVHFVVVRFSICGLPVFEKQQGVAFLGASCFWRASPFCLRFVAKSRVGLAFLAKKFSQDFG